ncbi:Tesmin/TSO1-like CXC domain-containing protein [Euphorbia peplus]|nr:Tesmin/TSO1-like CXC domain-containing protein [Euphorbia peplus]
MEELNTPNKNQILSSSLSHLEESPVFNYINNLSPIELVKSGQINDHTFSSLSFSSPPSVFASPKLNYQRDNNKSFLKRHHFSDLQKLHASQIRDEQRGCAPQVECTTSKEGVTANAQPLDAIISYNEQKMVDPGTISFLSNVIQVPQDNSNGMEDTDCVGFPEDQMGDPEIESIELRENEVDRIPALLSRTLLGKLADTNAATKMDVKGQKCQPSCKQQHSIRRLFYEVAGAHRKKLVCNTNTDGAPSSPQSDCKISHAEEKLPSSGLPVLSRKGIGLHLNALANASNVGKVIKIETVSSSTTQVFETVPCDSEDRLEENAPITSVDVSEDSGTNSPKIKRQKVEHVGSACKRCNCKRSKCLKLYCECFAAGLYCIEPCSCQDCFNKPAHEDKVLETRKQIESRNPLAFAPKVIRNTDFVSDFGDDESNKTPASARHKRGCNCKKSNCLKKYCECYQGGVGCSPNCRCEGCKNKFGTKNGLEETDFESSECEVNEKITSEDNKLQGVEEEHQDERMSSCEPARFRGQLLRSFPGIGSSSKISSCQKKLGTEILGQSKFETHLLHVIPEEDTPEILSSRSESNGVKSSSPNSKRVSPPHRGFGSSSTWSNSRKVILRSVPFPSLTSPNNQ